ncbi:hypothetical protein BGZ72_009360 [Mortierella alpina]|nr:hypothetical protein BGZ72_009360 [Mortierella alpina]
MLHSAAHRVFATAELVLLLSAHLTPHDLVQCNLVCKDWSRQFGPILWSSFCLTRDHNASFSDTPLKAALIRNLTHIRTVHIFFAEDTLLQILAHGSASDSSTRCTNLKKLEIEHISYDELELLSPYLTTLLDLNHRLTHLELPYEVFEDEAVSASVSKLENLKGLTITSFEQCEGNRLISSLLRACLPLPNLTLLEIDLDLIWDDDDQDIADLKAVIKEAAIARFSRHLNATKIKLLQLPSNRYGDSNPLPLLMLKSNLLDLETCEMPWFDKGTDPLKLTQVIQKHCPSLKHLRCPSFSGENEDGQTVCAFIRGCSGLQTFVSQYFSDSDPLLGPRSILSTLASQHFNTLEVLDLGECLQVYSDDQQAILSQCKRLRKYWVMNSAVDGCNIGIESTDVLTGDWVCIELITLGLTINRLPIIDGGIRDRINQAVEAVDDEDEDEDKDDDKDEDEDDDKDEDEDEAKEQLFASASKYLYSQIGRLEKLETLELDMDTGRNTDAKESDYAWDLTLSKGWLGEMAGLKNLRSLTLQADFWSKMGQAEMEFIHEHWPLLREIVLRGNAVHMNVQSSFLDPQSLDPMPRFAAQSVLATPELAFSVSTHLTPHDLAQCISVCKAWSRQFEPILWADFHLRKDYGIFWCPLPLKIALARNQPLIRTLRIAVSNMHIMHELANGSSTDPSTLCTNLKRLELEDRSRTHIANASQYLATLLTLNHRLTHLRLEFHAFANGAIAVALSKLESLQHLTVDSAEDHKGDRAIFLLLQACLPLPNLTELYIDFDLRLCEDWESTSKLETIIKAASIARFTRNPTAAKISSLTLPINTYGLSNPLPLLLLESKLLDLVSCEIPWIDNGIKDEEIEQVVRERCPNLKHLTNLTPMLQSGRDCTVRTFVRGCSGLQSFTAKYFRDHLYSTEPIGTISTLVRLHSNTLEALEITDCNEASSRDMQAVLSQCKRLKRFWVMCSSEGGRNIGIKSTDIRRGDWVCKDLVKLGLTLDRFPIIQDVFAELQEEPEDQEDEEDEEDDEYRATRKEGAERRLFAMSAKHFYTQIGRLEKLEILALDIDTSPRIRERKDSYAWDLTLSEGWLEEMAGLKNLKSLILQGDFWSKMGQAEVEFIHEHWPLLREVKLRGNDLQFSAQSPWLWLIHQRPQLRLDIKFHR